MDEFVYSGGVEHAGFVLRGLNETRRSAPGLCDFRVICEDRVFPCHRTVLCLFSEYFRGAIEGGFKEKLENEIMIQGISSKSVETILQFVYTGKLILNHSNVESLLFTSTRLGFNKVLNLCVDYIRHQIDERNCLEILKLAQEHRYESLEASAHQFLCDHICSVFKHELPESPIRSGAVLAILRDPQMHKRGEECLAIALLTWIQKQVDIRRDHASELLSHVLWRRLPAPFLLKELLRHPLMASDPAIKELVLDHVRRSYDDASNGNELMTTLSEAEQQQEVADGPLQRSLSTDSNSSLTPSYRNFRPRKAPHQALILIGGLSLGEAERGDTTQPNVMCYHPMERAWKKRAWWPERGLRGFSVTNFNNGVAVTGGCSTTVKHHLVIDRAWHYDPTLDRWNQLPDMNKQRAFHTSCELSGRLYAVGGSAGSNMDAEVFDRHLETWTCLKKPAPRVMDNFTASACNSKLILLGSGQPSTVFIQCYNPAVDSWTVVRSPNVPRHLSAPVCVAAPEGDKVFVGGDNTKKMYVYDPNTNTWSRGADMNNLHSNGNLVLLGGEVFVTGGHWEDDGYWDEMESYDVTSEAWTSKGALPHLWLYHGCATVYMDD
uniref:Kelch-like protein 21 n=1 Tax=Phallusia mammillata TaxID=59560 RepID=A0A6F9DGQ0_9ASCI|nr:kelch-like protein 21 [Phallusia mammillata]